MCSYLFSGNETMKLVTPLLIVQSVNEIMASIIKQLFFYVFSIQNSGQMYKTLKERYWVLGTAKGRMQVFLITTMNCPISCISLIAFAKDEKPYRI